MDRKKDRRQAERRARGAGGVQKIRLNISTFSMRANDPPAEEWKT